ncbi:eukaryotic and archaeal DNA primase small subunit [Lasiosphaeria miniovina]|uniref:DNA primase n=1 Tax=Lasiosphaeria miniovina TaxID=1954250 RepID=A0AA40DTL5_9PEZI|nr:eukaryotic and archaeal DNA primase small subunit [Lasiosphaeria miniovina]KAK0712971.1 eukaryotic and archaeal DNA primase small subunit [Lasiosphaeria miniovina]
MANAPPTTILDEGVASDEPVGSPEIKVKEVSEVKLEDIFAGVDSDEDDDEEFPGRPERVDRDQSNSPGSPREVGSSVKASDPALMRSFYQRLFPWRYLFQWLNHSPTPTDDFKHREFAFTLRNDAYLRYQAFASSDLLRKDVLRLMPSRFEIGPVYSANPRDRKMFQGSAAFRPLSKELCFDIDLTDYDDVRTCCGKANICNKCWQFITMAIKVVDVALRDDFGFKHILWVYSGRRGAHAWVCDKKARTMDDLKRRVIAGYLEVVRGGAQSGKKVNLRRPLHPHLTRSLDILKAHFQDDVLEAQDPWRSPEQSEKLLQLLPDKELIESLRKKWDSSPERASTSKWADIDAVAKASTSKNFDSKALLDAKQDIVLEYTYPRLDIEVSKKLNHLLKSPFVVHPGTGRVCVPIDTRSLEDFDPLGVPTVQSLIREIDAWTEDSDKQSQQDWEKTSLKPYIDCFRSFVMTLMKDERDVRVKREHDEDQPDSLEF